METTKSQMEKLVDYCVLGHDLQILDQDAIMRRVDAWCTDNGIEITSETRNTILKAIIEKSFRVANMPTWKLATVWDQTKTGPWGDLIDEVMEAEMMRRDRALGIAQ